MDLPEFSVIIPAYGEQERIAALLAHLAELPAPGGLEVLVADGHPERTTLAAMPQATIPQLSAGQENALHILGLGTAKGRALQMNAGAAAARGAVLLFLHADTRLPAEAFARIRSVLEAQPDLCGGAFSLEIVPENGAAGPGLRAIAWAANLRSRLTRAPYGDQAIFIRRRVFEAVSGYARIPLMEDLEFMTRLRRQGQRIAILPERARTSARRWEREGLLRCTARNLLLRALYHLGVSPQRLARYYP